MCGERAARGTSHLPRRAFAGPSVPADLKIFRAGKDGMQGDGQGCGRAGGRPLGAGSHGSVEAEEVVRIIGEGQGGVCLGRQDGPFGAVTFEPLIRRTRGAVGETRQAKAERQRSWIGRRPNEKWAWRWRGAAAAKVFRGVERGDLVAREGAIVESHFVEHPLEELSITTSAKIEWGQ